MFAPALHLAIVFDLVCSGSQRTGPVGLALPEADGEPVSVTYRIDLDSRTWCSDDCAARETVSSVFEGVIVLRDDHDSEGSNVVMINPGTGRFTDTRIEGDTATLTSGTCAAARFSGFPSPSA